MYFMEILILIIVFRMYYRVCLHAITNSVSKFYESVDVLCVKFKINDVLVIDFKEIKLTFGVVQKILSNNGKLFFVIQLFEEGYFDGDLQAFVVKNCNKFKYILLFRNTSLYDEKT